jgi:DNA invertase Pin-like site-specific DNA recombinase
MLKFVGYLRTSTADQSLGIEAQRSTVAAFVDQRGGRLIATFEEKESGARPDRPELTKALAYAQARGATLLVAKLDRLSRDVEFLARLLKGDVPLAFCDLPNADRLIVTVMAGVAQWERERISTRTREALAAKKAAGYADGRIPGNRAGAAAFGQDGRARGQVAGAAKVRDDAQAFAERLRDDIERARAAGAVSLRDIADHLNADDVETRRGGRWDASSVSRVLRRLETALPA